MNHHKAETLIATCIDFRLQSAINNWISKNLKPDTFDRLALAGSVKDLDKVLGQVKIASDLHQIKKVVLVNHEDCGAYGTDGTYKKHVQDLKNAEGKIKSLYPNLKVEIYYLHLSGEFEKIP